MANQDPRGCGLLALVAIVAVVAFLGGRASVSWPGEPSPPGAVGDTAPAIIAATRGPAPLPTPRTVFVPPATPAPAPSSAPAIEPPVVAETAEAPPDGQATAPPPAANVPAPAGGGGCDPSYPTVCIPPPPPDLDCSITDEREFEVRPPDPHGLDSDGDGIGCEPVRLVPGQPAGPTSSPRSLGNGATTEPGG